ncbi:MAG TPA: energy transducer TonB [Cytophaga sp.]|jgi:TonB family protein|nr:energy transducer TonB [Cytophaga sp.]
MHKLFLPIILFVLSICCMAQTSQTVHYYKDQYLRKEVQKGKASFSETITKTEDTITTEVKDIKNNKVIRSESYKGEEPVGIWIIQTGDDIMQLDYNFTVVYSDDSCTTIPGMVIIDYFHDNDSIHYVAPKIKNGQMSVIKFILNNVLYPESAKRKWLQGMSTILFTITADGHIENIRAGKGSNIVFDKEAIRVIKLISLLSPATLNGETQSICVKQKIKFNLM